MKTWMFGSRVAAFETTTRSRTRPEHVPGHDVDVVEVGDTRSAESLTAAEANFLEEVRATGPLAHFRGESSIGTRFWVGRADLAGLTPSSVRGSSRRRSPGH